MALENLPLSLDLCFNLLFEFLLEVDRCAFTFSDWKLLLHVLLVNPLVPVLLSEFHPYCEVACSDCLEIPLLIAQLRLLLVKVDYIVEQEAGNYNSNGQIKRNQISFS